MNVESVKQIKLIVNEGQMPSSKPEFSDFGLDWQTDWETEISKTMFATAFGITAQPMEGDLISFDLATAKNGKPQLFEIKSCKELQTYFQFGASYYSARRTVPK